MTTIKYNHVYNVCKAEVYKNHLEGEISTAREGGTKKATILEALQSGKTITEVSKELGCLYNQVWQIAKAAGLRVIGARADLGGIDRALILGA